MSIRLPLKTIVSSDNSGEVGAGSVGGGVIIGPFQIPQDTDNVVLKLIASTGGAGVSAQLQTTDDGGTTWYGVGRTSIVSLSTGDNAEWLSVPVNGFGYRTGGVGTSVVATGSVVSFGSVGGATGSAQPSTVGIKSLTGLPILSQTARVIIQLQPLVDGSPTLTTQVKINSQSATA
jgi:hypothetical protein